MKKPPVKTSLARTKVIGEVAGKIAGKKIITSTKSLFLNPDDKISLHARSRQEIAQMIFEGLSKLRGTALKLAQLFCGETGLLPQEYMTAFEQSHYRVPPLSSVLVRNVLRREYGEDPSLVFLEFGTEAIAAASLGQVHKARLKSGESVAVKVQYPGIAESVVNDFSMARKLLRPFANTGLIANVLDELEDRLRQEVDYLAEQRHLNWFRNVQLPDGIYIPRITSPLTRPQVLVMEFVEGLHFDQWLATRPSQARIDKVANSLFEFFLKSVFVWQRLHVDPNFGNFLIKENDDVAVIDFGAVKQLNDDELTFYKLLWCTTEGADCSDLLSLYESRGAKLHGDGISANQNLINTAISPYLKWIQQLLSPDKFDFKANPNFVKEGHEIFSQQLFNPQLQNFNSGLTLVHRTLLGMAVIFQRLGAELDLERHRKVWQ